MKFSTKDHSSIMSACFRPTQQMSAFLYTYPLWIWRQQYLLPTHPTFSLNICTRKNSQKKVPHKKGLKKNPKKFIITFFLQNQKKLLCSSIWPSPPTHLFADVILEWSPMNIFNIFNLEIFNYDLFNHGLFMMKFSTMNCKVEIACIEVFTLITLLRIPILRPNRQYKASTTKMA